MRVALLAFLLLTATASLAQNDDDAAVTKAALAAWRAEGGEIRVAPENDVLSSVGIASFADKLQETGVEFQALIELGASLFKRNETKEEQPPVREPYTLRIARPGFDNARKHAIVVASTSNDEIWLAVFKRNDGDWSMTWKGAMKAVKLVANPASGLPAEGDPDAYRVGGEVKPPIVVRRVSPKWSDEARAARARGIVILEAIIDDAGRVESVKVLKGMPFGLSESAVEALKQWEFKPGTLDDKPVRVIFNLTIAFRPDEGEH